MFEFLKPKPKPKEIERSQHNGESLTDDEINIMRTCNGCPDCSGTLYEGPCGGGSQNVRCGTCRAEFNIMMPMGIDRISERNPLYADLLKGLEDKADATDRHNPRQPSTE